MEIINNEHSFLAKKNLSSITEYIECLDKFSSDFNKAISLENEFIIFLDTNVLLRYYSISFTARAKLFEFIKENSKRIVLSSQVQYEFIKNREDVIQRFFEQVTNKIPKDFNSDIVNKMKSFLETHKIVLKDYPFVETGIVKCQVELEKLLTKLNETSEGKRKEYTDLIVKDSFLDLLKECLMTEPLFENEIKKIKSDFDELKKLVKSEKLDSVFLNSHESVFPGLGDIVNKPDNPYGDFIIYHEIMKYQIKNKTNVIFLTFDNTKGDWMTKDKSTYLHYVQNMFLNTGKILYILDADRTLGKVLNVNIESLVEKESEDIIALNVQSLTVLVKSHVIYNDVKHRELWAIN